MLRFIEPGPAPIEEELPVRAWSALGIGALSREYAGCGK